mgnify:CR=1 FL=1
MQKPGEGMTQRLMEREKKMRAALARIEQQKKEARDRVTGKTKAQAYVRLWLEKLTATELRHECGIRGFLYEDFETMEQAMDMVGAAMFAGVVVCGDAVPVTGDNAQPMTYRDSPEEGEHADVD